jgi:HD-like signal output (HDOD) protein
MAADQLLLPLHLPPARQGLAVLAGAEPSPEALIRLVGQDPVFACSLFRLANSAFYQGLPKVSEAGAALTRIGMEAAIAELTRLCTETVSADTGKLLPAYLPALWVHSYGCALGARWLAERCGYPALAEQAHLAGLVHDIGKYWLVAGMEELVAEGETPLLLPQLVEEVLASRHVEAGLRLHAAWNLPEPFAAVIGGHHDREVEGQELVVVLVRLANQGCRKLGLGGDADPELVLPTTAEAQFLGIDEIALAEFEIMLEDQFL